VTLEPHNITMRGTTYDDQDRPLDRQPTGNLLHSITVRACDLFARHHDGTALEIVSLTDALRRKLEGKKP
jgi:hypothetical protein